VSYNNESKTRVSFLGLSRVVSDGVVASFAMSGIFITRLNRPRALATVFTAGTTALVLATRYVPSLEGIWWAFASAFVIRYLLLFLSFVPDGIADRLKRRWGPERGFAVYEALTAVMFQARGLTFAWLVAPPSGP
jgi:hypothetical protein